MTVQEEQTSDERGAGPGIEQMLATAVEAFRVAAETPRLCERLASANVTCALHLTDLDTGLTALLDRSPIEVVDRVEEDTDIRISGTAEQWLPVFTEGNLGIALLREQLEWHGPVRQFLRIFPIFKTVYASVARGERSAGDGVDEDRPVAPDEGS